MNVTVVPVNDPPVAIQPFSQGLIAYYPFDSSANDTVGAHAGTITGSTFGNGKFSNALVTTASTDMVTLATPIPLGTSWTITTWFSSPLNPTGRWRTLTRGNGCGDHQVIILNSGYELGSYDNCGGSAFHGSGFQMSTLNNGWHHLAAVGSGGTTSFYIDGRLVGTVNTQSTSNIYAIGNYQGGGQPWGTMDDFRVYNRALPASEIQMLSAGLSGFTALMNTSDKVPVMLSGTDVDGNALTAKITALPLHGTLYQTVDGYTLGAPIVNPYTTVSDAYGRVVFAAPANWAGVTGFDYVVNDGLVDSAPATVTMTVQDVQPPVLTPPADAYVEAGSASGTAASDPYIQAFMAALQVVDNVGVVSLQNDAPGVFPIGRTPVSFIAVDAAGNTASTTAAVIVRDTTAPVITLNGGNMAIPAGSVFNDPGATVSDAVSTGLTAQITGVVDTAITGSYTLTYTASDAAGNAAQPVSRLVTVFATSTAPVFVNAPLADVYVEATGVTTPYALATPVVTDPNDPVVSVTVDNPGPYPVGITPLRWTATDSYGTATTVTQQIIVSDTTAPSVSAPAPMMVIAQDGYGAPITDPYIVAWLAAATATDSVGVVSTYHDAPTQFPLGRTTVTFSASDAAGNRGTATSYVDVYTYINGVLAAGRPLANGLLTVRDLYGNTATAVADAYGAYQLQGMLIPPLLLQVDRYALPSLFSVSLDGYGYAHVTTLSTLITARLLNAANSAQIQAAFADPYSSGLMTPTRLTAIVGQLKAMLGISTLSRLGRQNPLDDPAFRADGTGFDAVMDALSLNERDEDGDGLPDLVLASRAPGAAAVLSVSSLQAALLTGAGSFAIPGAALMGDDVYGQLIQEGDLVLPGAPATVINTGVLPLTALAYNREEVSRILPAAVATADANGLNMNDPYTRQTLGYFVGELLVSLQRSQHPGMRYDTTLEAQVQRETAYVLAPSVDVYGSFTPGFDPYAAAQTTVWRMTTPTQAISAVPGRMAASAARNISIGLDYQTSDSAMTTGLGLRIYYDASRLSWTGLSGVWPGGLLAQDSLPQPDVNNDDHDPATDSFIGIAWADLYASWPGNGQPVRLANVGFSLLPATVGSVTTIHIGTTSAAATHHATTVDVPVTMLATGTLVAAVQANNTPCNVHWSVNNSPYVVQDSVTVPPGCALAIDPYVIVRFAAGTTLDVYGVLDTYGQAGGEIVLTSLNDDAYGLTVAGSNGQPAPNDWAGIRYFNGASGSLQFAHIRYAGTGVFIRNASPHISDVLISNSHAHGVDVQAYAGENSSPLLTALRLSGTSAGSGIALYSTAGGIVAPLFQNCEVSGIAPAYEAVNVTGTGTMPSFSNITISGGSYALYVHHGGSGSITGSIVRGALSDGIHLGDGTAAGAAGRLVIADNRIVNHGGAGIYANALPAGSVISRNLIRGNAAGGVYIAASQAWPLDVYANLIVENYSLPLLPGAVRLVGGADTATSAHARFYSNTIANNSNSGDGDAGLVADAYTTLLMRDNIFAYNRRADGTLADLRIATTAVTAGSSNNSTTLSLDGLNPVPPLSVQLADMYTGSPVTPFASHWYLATQATELAAGSRAAAAYLPQTPYAQAYIAAVRPGFADDIGYYHAHAAAVLSVANTSLSPGIIHAGNRLVVFTLIPRDATGNRLGAGLQFTASLGAGITGARIGQRRDMGDGRYEIEVDGTQAIPGSADVLTVTVQDDWNGNGSVTAQVIW